MDGIIKCTRKTSSREELPLKTLSIMISGLNDDTLFSILAFESDDELHFMMALITVGTRCNGPASYVMGRTSKSLGRFLLFRIVFFFS